MSLLQHLAQQLGIRRQQSLYRSRRLVDTAQAVEVRCNGQPLINFSSNDYLGLANHPRVISAFRSAANEYGVGSGAAHLICGHMHPHHALEEELAEFVGRERALLFSTGYMANLGVISGLLQRHDEVLQDKLNHASLLDAGQLSRAKMTRYAHVDMTALGVRLRRSNARFRLVATDAVFSMDGDLAPLAEMARITTECDATLMVDDAHGFGVLGDTGAGSAEHFALNEQQLPILMATLGKALGTFGAFVAGSETLIESLIQQSRSYVYTTALPPAVAAAARTSLQIVKTEPARRQRLRELITRFRTGARQLGLSLMPSETPIQPLLVGEAQHAVQLADALRVEHFLLQAIRSPTVPDGSARLRITLCAEHRDDHVDSLLETLGRLVPAYRNAVC